MTIQFSLLFQTQNPTDFSGVSKEGTWCSLKTSSLSKCRGRGVRVKKESDLAVITLGVRFIPPTTANAVKKILCSSLVYQFSVKHNPLEPYRAGCRRAGWKSSSSPAQWQRKSQKQSKHILEYSPAYFWLNVFLCFYKLLWLFLPVISLSDIWTHMYNHYPRRFTFSGE